MSKSVTNPIISPVVRRADPTKRGPRGNIDPSLHPRVPGEPNGGASPGMKRTARPTPVNPTSPDSPSSPV